MSPQSEKMFFSGREDDATYEDYMPNVRNGASDEQRTQAVYKPALN